MLNRALASWLTARVVAWLWLACVLLVAWQQWQFWHGGRLQTDLFALLPADERIPEAEQATRALADAAARQIVILVGASTWDEARQAGSEFEARWLSLDSTLRTGEGLAVAGEELVPLLAPWRNRLLTSRQEHLLRTATTAELSENALAVLHQPGLALRMSSWTADPLGLWTEWWLERANQNPVRLRDGLLSVNSSDGSNWVVLSRETADSAFSFDGTVRHAAALDQVEAEIRDRYPGVTVLRAGVPLHAEAAAAQAAFEVNLIGWGSLLAIVLLMWFAFGSVRPIACVTLTLLVGCATALAVTTWVFGEIHLITVIFGASLVGVAEDYGIHFFAGLADRPLDTPGAVLRRQWPGMLLALLTSALAYMVLAVVPFPGLRQMALFSAVGLIAAFLTVYCWFPFLAGRPRELTRFAKYVASAVQRWPSWWSGGMGLALAMVLVLLLALPLLRMPTNDDVRQLQSSPPALMKSQQLVQSYLRLASPAQFYLVSGVDANQVMEREENLIAALATQRDSGQLGGWSALSDWVPSQARQDAAAKLTASADAAVLSEISQIAGDTLTRPDFAPQPLSVDEFLRRIPDSPLRTLWLGAVAPGHHVSIVLLSGISRPEQLQALEQLGTSLAGVQWVDRVGQMSALLQRYREAMSLMLLGGFVVVALVLHGRFRQEAWRAWLPTLLAMLITLVMLRVIGEPLQLFHILALFIVLGIGVDYGIFLVEHHSDRAACLSVVLGAASTWLSFGLLALSSTPALHAFGLTMALGIGSVALLSPMFRPVPLSSTGLHS